MRPARRQQKTLLDLLIKKHAVIHAACGGNGRCGQCRVRLKGRARPPTTVERSLIPGDLLKQGYRLACQYAIKGGIPNYRDSEWQRMDIGLASNAVSAAAPVRCGLALDLGTTVIKGARVDLERCEVISTAKIYNPQNSEGADVMTRISAALGGRYDALRGRLLKGISAIIRELDFPASAPARTAVAGNPVMSSFYLGKPVAGLARYPYAGAITRSIRRKSRDLFVYGSIGGFVGGDTISGILASGLHERSGAALYIDLGTNGEIALITKRRIHALSAAAGPAFEGAGLKCGSLAIPGAIDAVAESGQRGFRIHTIGDKEPRGVCASGLIDLLAVLLRRGWLTRNGRLLKKVRIGSIIVEPADIRQLQLAIGAIHTGLQFLMEHAGLAAGGITDTIITGEFGSHLRIASLRQIGIIPAGLEKVRLERDLPLKGAIRALCDERAHRAAEAIRRRSRHIELAMQPDFQRRYLRALLLAPWTR